MSAWDLQLALQLYRSITDPLEPPSSRRRDAEALLSIALPFAFRLDREDEWMKGRVLESARRMIRGFPESASSTAEALEQMWRRSDGDPSMLPALARFAMLVLAAARAGRRREELVEPMEYPV